LNRRVTILGLAGYLLIGAASVLVPSVMPSITAEFSAAGLSLATIGLILPARSVGGMFGNLLSGVASDVLGRKRLVWLSALGLAASLVVTAAALPWGLFVAGFVLVSTAQGAVATGINALVADANRDARAKALNILHGVYGAGAAVSPLIIGFALSHALAWRWALAGTGLIWAVYGLAAMLLYGHDHRPTRAGPAAALDMGMLRQGPFMALSLIAFLYNGVAYSLLGWVAVFMQESAGLSAFFSVATVSVFYVALTVGRFVCAAYAERVGYSAVFLVLAVGVTLSYPLVVLDLHPWLVVSGVFLTGLSMSGLFPTAAAYGSRLYPEQTGTVSGTLNAAMTLGGMVPPLWTGALAGLWGLQTALVANYILVPPLIILALYLRRWEIPRSAAPL